MTDQSSKYTSSIFNSNNVKFNLDPNFSNFSLSGVEGSNLVFSIDENSSFTPKIIAVGHIDELKKYIGSDSTDDHQILYPAPFSSVDQEILDLAKDNKPYDQLLTKKVLDNIGVAYSAYINGVSSKLGEYKELLNTLYFPLNLAYFACDSGMEISQNITVEGSSPVLINTTDITFKALGTIVAQTQFILACNSMTK